MSSIFLGPIEINSNEGIIITGNTINASPTSTGKTIAGSGSFNTGFNITNNNGISTSQSYDPDEMDSIITEEV